MWRDPYGYKPLWWRAAEALSLTLLLAIGSAAIANLLSPLLPLIITGLVVVILLGMVFGGRRY